ncbi:MAG: tetratricopeptide repeat protein [Verrucomicrobiales bacterium]|nr:tetratricopeptide repeat protein [Verrucomicrobiales bacterium]
MSQLRQFIRSNSSVLCQAALVLSCLLHGGTPGQTQEEDLTDPVIAYNKSVSAIQLRNWGEALKLTNGVIAEHGNGAMKRFGPVFGHFYFLKGLALLGNDQAKESIEAFKTCYETYSNEILSTGTDDEIKGLLPNLFRNAALVQWANAEMKTEQYVAAKDLFEKVLVVGKDDSKVNLIHVGVNLGRCYLKAGDLKKGYEFMSRPLGNTNLSDGLRETIYMIIAEDWTPEVEFPEVLEFLQTYSEVVDNDPFIERYDRNDRFQYLAQLALQKQDPVRALAWYERIVNPRLLLPEYEQRFESLKNRPVPEELGAKKAEVLNELSKQLNDLEQGYIQTLNGVGSSHFMLQNFPGSYVAFSQLSDQAGKSHPERPVFLHNAVVSAAQIEKWKEAYQYGKQFLDEFPEHDLKPAVARVLVELLFLREEYDEAFRVSGEVRQDMTAGEAIRDVPDFVYGASAFHLGEMETAETELSAYFQTYTEGERREMVHFFLGLTKVQLRKWEEAAGVFSEFLSTYPKSPLTPPVLYQAALSEFMIDRLEDAVAKVNRIHEEFPNHETAPPAWNLKGDIASTLEAPMEEIEFCYTNGRDGGIRFQQSDTTAYSLWQLLMLAVDNEQWDAAAQHYQQFQDDYADSDYRNDFLVAALPMLVEQGRADEGRQLLRDRVWENRTDPESATLSEMFGSYVDFLESNYENDFLQEQLREIQFERGTTPALRGWAMIALADSMEQAEADADTVNKIYYQLEAGFKSEEHSNYPAVRLARWITEVRKRPEEARGLYEYILENRPGTPNYDYCLVDVAQIQAQSDDPAVREEAMQKFAEVVSAIPNEELREKAVLGMARIRMQEKKYEEAIPHWEKYLENRSWSLSRPEANYSLASCYEQQGNLADALKIYVSVYANFPGHLDWSTRAYLRTAAITKGSGEDLKALQILQDMLKRMGHLDHPGVEKAKEVFGTWRVEYAAKVKSQENAK